MLPYARARRTFSTSVTVALAGFGVGQADLSAQRIDAIPESLVRTVMPDAERFSEASGDPAVRTAYVTRADGSEVVYGYVFLTSDVPPEQFGYSGPIEALVGLRPDGTITGMRVTDYMESYMRSMGDFLRTPGFQEQYAGKHLGDPFQLWGDIEGISRVSISVRALSRGVRDAARRVAARYGGGPDLSMDTEVVDPVGLSWFELRQRGFVERVEVTEPGEGSAGISLGWIANDRLGNYFFGPQLYERALRAVERRGGAENLVLYAIDGSRLRLFRQEGWTIEQDDEVVPIDRANVVSLGLPSGGIVSGEATMVGVMLVGGDVDMSRPFSFVYDLGDLGEHRIDYLSEEARITMAESAAAEAARVAAAEAAALAEAEAAAREAEAAVEEGEATAGAPVEAAGPGADGGAADGAPDGADASDTTDAATDAATADPQLDFVLTEDESVMERMLAGTSWSRVGLMTVVLLLATIAFFSKQPALRWVSLAVTLVGLGFMDGGFLSVSHITSGIWAGVGVYLRDLPLLMIVVFTLVTTLVWGRVFCGFLCPFGALQDVIERVVPERWQRDVPAAIHDRAVWVKYLILAAVIVPPLFGSQASIYQYVEPFGTVFFLSPDLVLWSIAGVILIASVFVPRFYCRYACPLGAALGVVSLVSLKRIPRVEQCQHCFVCEQKCPTGAIRGPKVDFKECVRCNTCEVLLIEKRGVCQHDMEVIRPRLVQIRTKGQEGAHV